jgi:NADPH2:quinone reductase
VWGQTSSDEAAAWVRQRGVDQVVVCEADELADRVADLAPTVVFDPLGGAFTGQAVDALAEHGRLVIFGTSAGDRGTVPLQALYGKGLTLYGFGGLIEPPEEMAAAAHQALEALAAARLEVAVDAVVPLAEVNEAFERLDRHDVRGKLVLDLS